MLEFKNIYSDDFSNKLSLRYYPRTLTVRAKKTFTTPTRIVTDSEYSNKTTYPNKIKLDDNISIITNYFNVDDLQSFINKNGAMKKLCMKVENFTKHAVDSPLSLLSIRPNTKEHWPKLNEDQFARFVRFLNYAEKNLSTRSLPDMPLNFSYKTAFEEFSKQYDNSNPVIWLYLEEEGKIFKKKVDILKELVKDGRLQIIGLYARRSSTVIDYNVNLDYLYSNFKDQEVLLIYEGSFKSFQAPYFKGPSKLHYHPFEVFDAISPYKYPKGGGGKKLPLEKINSTSFLNEYNISYEKFKDVDKELLYHYTDSASKRLIDQIYAMVENNEKPDDRTIKQFKAFSNIQQIQAGSNEMHNISKDIMSRASLDYLNEKADLGKIVKNKLQPKLA